MLIYISIGLETCWTSFELENIYLYIFLGELYLSLAIRWDLEIGSYISGFSLFFTTASITLVKSGLMAMSLVFSGVIGFPES